MFIFKLVVLQALSEKSITDFVQGQQLLCKELSFAAGSQVSVLKHNMEANRACSFSAVVRAEMKASEGYKVACTLTEHEISNALCNCIAIQPYQMQTHCSTFICNLHCLHPEFAWQSGSPQGREL
jgi:hypothetical protein